MTIDTDGTLWVAVVCTGKVIKNDPRNPETQMDTIEFPTPTVRFFGYCLSDFNIGGLFITVGSLLPLNYTG